MATRVQSKPNVTRSGIAATALQCGKPPECGNPSSSPLTIDGLMFNESELQVAEVNGRVEIY